MYFHAKFQAPSLKNDQVMTILNQNSRALHYTTLVTLEYSSKSVDFANKKVVPGSLRESRWSTKMTDGSTSHFSFTSKK